MSRPPSNNKSQPHRNPSISKDVGNQSMERSDVAKSRISNPQPTPKKTSTKERIKNYSKMQQNKLNQQQEPLDRNKVIDQNNRLKNQIAELLLSMDQILEKEKEKREQAIQKHHQRETDEEILELQDLLRTQEKEIADNKGVIKMLQRQLENTYEINKVVDKENELRHKQNELKQLKEEQESLNKIIKNQRDALNFLNNEQEYDAQLGEVKKNLAKAKETNRSLADELLMAEKQLQRVREQNIAKQKKTEELEKKIRDAKRNPNFKVTQLMIDKLEEEVKALEAQRNEEEKAIRETLKGLDAEKNERKIELERKSVKLSSMEKEIRLNKIIITEQAKFMRIQQSEALEKHSDFDKRSGSSYKPNLMRRQNSRDQQKTSESVKANETVKRNDSKGSLRKGEATPQPQKASVAVDPQPTDIQSNSTQRNASPPVQKVKYTEHKQSDSYTNPSPPKKAATPPIEENYEEEFEDVTPVQKTPIQSSRNELEEPIDEPKQDIYSKPAFMMKKKK